MGYVANRILFLHRKGGIILLKKKTIFFYVHYKILMFMFFIFKNNTLYIFKKNFMIPYYLYSYLF